MSKKKTDPKDIFKKFYEITGQDLPKPKDLSDDEKIILAYTLKHSGNSVASIAKYFGVSRPTIYSWVNKYVEETVSEIENKTYLDLFAEILTDLMSRRDIYRNIIADLNSPENTVEVDPATNLPVKKTTHLKNLAEVGRLARDYDSLIIDLMKHVGFIPKDDASSLFGTLKDRDPSNISEDKDLVEFSDEEVDELLLRKITKKGSPILGDTKLKKIKDEKLV
jgi:transposase-like protein